MRSFSRPPLPSFATGLALGGVLLAVLSGTARVSSWAEDEILRRLAEATAIIAWNGQANAAGETSQVAAPPIEGIVRSRVLRPSDGELAIEPAQRALRTGTVVVEISHGASAQDGTRLARIYLPLKADGVPREVAELTIDQSESWQRVHGTLWVAGLAGAGLAAFGFGVPLAAFLRQRRLRAVADRHARYLAQHDPVTGLLNRSRFVELLDEAILERNPSEGVALLWIDLDGVREVNELHGHDSGDAVLVRTAEALQDLSRGRAIVARFGGDKFALCLPRVASAVDVKNFASSLLEAVAAPRTIGQRDIALSAKIGIALTPGDGEDALRLLKAAGLALDRARLRPGSCFVFFERAIETELQRRRELEQQIRDTLAAEAFELHFQPLFETASERLTGFEALLRMPDGAGGFVSPAVFVPIAEEIGLITEIGRWVLRRACALAVNWPDHLSVSLNLSPAQFKAGHVYRTVQEALLEAGLPADRLELEITEGLILNDDAAILRELADLKALGVSIVMDDFGTGYSSLSYLWKFPFSKIKIDRAFVLALGSDDRQVADVLHAVVSLSRALRMRVTAEGVETEAQASFLKTLGCDEVQGFYFGKPVPIDQVALVIVRDVQRLEAWSPAPVSPAHRLAAG